MRNTRLPIALCALLLLTFGLCATWGLVEPDRNNLATQPDQLDYVRVARSLLQDHQFRLYDARPNIQEELWAYRTPGYPAFLAACGDNLTIIRIVQALIATSTVLGVYILARQWLSARTAFLAALLIAVNPYMIYFSGMILTETLYTAMLVWGMVLLARRGRGGTPAPGEGRKEAGFAITRRMIWGLVVLALATLVRPSGMYLPILLAAGAVLLRFIPDAAETPRLARFRDTVGSWLNARTVGACIVSACIAVVIIYLILLPWAARNKAILGKWVWTATNTGVSLYDGYNPIANGGGNQSFIDHMPQLRYPRMNETSRNEYFSQLAKQWAWSHPARVLELIVLKIDRTCSPMPLLSRQYGHWWRYLLVAIVYSTPLDVLIVLGLLGRRLAPEAKLFLLIPAFYFMAVHALTVGDIRYRIPMEAPLSIIAACGLAMVCDKVMSVRNRSRQTALAREP